MKKSRIQTAEAPAAVGPYSQAILTGEFIFTSGQLALKSDGQDLTGEPIQIQTEQVIKNLKAVLEASGSGLDLVVKATVFLTDMKEFAEMNAVYMKYFPEPFPARSAIGVAALPRNAKVEIEAVALKR
jgi:2-iminobutanoate/2-iminopropanoate deaminase